MSPLVFLISLAGLAGGTYLLRLTGVRLGGMTRTAGPDETGPSPARTWLDRSAVVLIAAVALTTAVFDGQELADPARLIGVGAGVLALICRAPMLIGVILAMAVTGGLRVSGLLG